MLKNTKSSKRLLIDYPLRFKIEFVLPLNLESVLSLMKGDDLKMYVTLII